MSSMWERLFNSYYKPSEAQYQVGEICHLSWCKCTVIKDHDTPSSILSKLPEPPHLLNFWLDSIERVRVMPWMNWVNGIKRQYQADNVMSSVGLRRNYIIGRVESGQVIDWSLTAILMVNSSREFEWAYSPSAVSKFGQLRELLPWLILAGVDNSERNQELGFERAYWRSTAWS